MHCDPDICDTADFHPILVVLDEGLLNNPTDACRVSRNKDHNIKLCSLCIPLISIALKQTWKTFLLSCSYSKMKHTLMPFYVENLVKGLFIF